MWIYFKMLNIPVLGKLNFQQPLLLSSVSHDPSYINLKCWFTAQETFLIIFKVENSALMFLCKLWYIILGFFDE